MLRPPRIPLLLAEAHGGATGGQMPSSVRGVAIVGAGPSGAALAYHLGRAGIKVALFDRKSRPPIVVGESLVAATIPFLRELGIEDEVRFRCCC